MRRAVVLLLVVAACGDATGVGELGLRDGVRVSLSYRAVVFYDCSEPDTTGVLAIPLPPRDTAICGAAVDTLLLRHDTITASARLTRVEGHLPLFPGGVEFQGDGTGRHVVCPADGSACTTESLTGMFVVSRTVVPCFPPGNPGDAIQRDAYLGPVDLGPMCERSGRDSLGVAFVVFGSPVAGGAFAGIGAEVDGQIEGIHAIWFPAVPRDSSRAGVPIAGLLRELPEPVWSLTVQ